MAQISSFGALPDPDLHTAAAGAVAGAANLAQKSASSPATGDETQASPLQPQLTRLSAVLNGLQKNASNTRSQYVQALDKVKSGTYNVDSLDVSRSIVSDLLSNN